MHFCCNIFQGTYANNIKRFVVKSFGFVVENWTKLTYPKSLPFVISLLMKIREVMIIHKLKKKFFLRNV